MRNDGGLSPWILVGTFVASSYVPPVPKDKTGESCGLVGEDSPAQGARWRRIPIKGCYHFKLRNYSRYVNIIVANFENPMPLLWS